MEARRQRGRFIPKLRLRRDSDHPPQHHHHPHPPPRLNKDVQLQPSSIEHLTQKKTQAEEAGGTSLRFLYNPRLM